jgi:hypothetical protein
MILLLKSFLFLVLIFASKRYIKKNFNRIEVTTLFFFNVSFTLLLYKMISLNTKWYIVNENYLHVITSDIDRILILPYITLLLFIVFKRMHLRYKIIASISWLMALPLLEHINKWTGIVAFNNWGLFSSFIESIILLIGSLTFLYWYNFAKAVKQHGT